jgi:hypothetical protein
MLRSVIGAIWRPSAAAIGFQAERGDCPLQPVSLIFLRREPLAGLTGLGLLDPMKGHRPVHEGLKVRDRLGIERLV